jgi:hypothetical protein
MDDRDSVNDIFDLPLAYHKSIVDAARPYGYQSLNDVADLVDKIKAFRRSAAVYRDSLIHSSRLTDEWNELLSSARALRVDCDVPSEGDIYLQLTSLALELLLHLTFSPHISPPFILPSPPGIQPQNLTCLATQLKESFLNLLVRPCMFMDLVSIPLLLGAVAADADGGNTETEQWFVGRIRRAVRTLKDRGWERPLGVVVEGVCLVPEDRVVERFRGIWRELDG